MPLELEVINVNQLTWANAHAQVRRARSRRTSSVAPLGTRMLLSAELNLILGAIELLLGGSGARRVAARAPAHRHRLGARPPLLRPRCRPSSRSSGRTSPSSSSLGGLDMHLETAQTAPVCEPTLALHDRGADGRRLRDDRAAAPVPRDRPVADRSPRATTTATEDGSRPSAVRRAVGGVDMTVRAEVAAVELPIEQVLALQPGDVCRLDAPPTTA